MVDPDRRPTAQDIEELIGLVRRDPASPAFIDLGLPGPVAPGVPEATKPACDKRKRSCP
jgi:hypothetical protein